MCDISTWPWSRFLLNMPLSGRLALCIISFPVCMSLYFTISMTTYSGCILTIPVAIAAWTFTKKGAYTCLFTYIVVRIIYNLFFFHTILWPLASFLVFLSDTLLLFIKATVIVAFREKIDTSKTTQLHVEQLESQTSLIHEAQRYFNQIKNQFMLNVNHELRTPLAATYGYIEFLQLLLEQNGQLDYPTHAPYIKNALHYCEDLRSTVNKVLDTIEIGAANKPLQVENVSVDAVVNDIFNSIDDFCREQQRIIYLDIPLQLEVQANAQGLRNVLHNLLSNAFKFSPDDAPIIISAELWKNKQEVCISVKDEGPGIPADERQHVFEQFVRLQRDLAGTIRGTGLGLSISKHLVENMQGHIWVESTGIAGQGSCFRFTLPHANQSCSTKIAS